MSRVSVVMPVYNAADTVGAAVETILKQTFPDLELLVVDDGSLDDSAAVVARYAETDPRIRLVRAEHGGIVHALRAGCGEACSEFIARMDADDWCAPERLARQLAVMEEQPAVALCGTHVKLGGTAWGSGRERYAAWLNGLVTHDDMTRELFVECPIAHPTFMMRRDAFETVGGYRDAGWAEDYDLVMRLACAGHRFAKTPEELVEWRHSETRLSVADERYSLAKFRELKRHYLFQMFLTQGSDESASFFQWGAGEVGKMWLREWGKRHPAAVVDIHPRKIGIRIHGIPVIAPEDLPPAGKCFVVVAVGAPGARTEIRAWFQTRGYVELADFLFVA